MKIKPDVILVYRLKGQTIQCKMAQCKEEKGQKETVETYPAKVSA